MKNLLPAFISLCCYISLKAQPVLNVISFNIRYDNPRDSLNAWPYRKDKVAGQLLFHHAHIIGVQEALHNQVQDLQERLPQYKYTGVGRTDGKEKGEYAAIFYDTVRLQLLQTATFWLAEQTDIPGKKGWDAAIERIVTWAKFTDRVTKKTFYHFNTHFDHVGKIARRESAALLLKKVNDIAGKTPAVITGDFNAHPNDEPIAVIVDKQNPLHLTDSKEITAAMHYGPEGTFNAFQSKEINDQPIDYIFVKNKVRVFQHATLSQSWQGRFSSDHFPVFAALEIE